MSNPEQLERRLLLTDWTQLGLDIEGIGRGDRAGWSVASNADGTIVAVGSIFFEPRGSIGVHGRVQIFQIENDNWNQLGADIVGDFGDLAGYSVSLSDDGKTVAIGAPDNDESEAEAGVVRVYQFNNTDWTQIGSDIVGRSAGVYSGSSVSLSSDGNRVAIGAPQRFSVGPGYAAIYENVDGEWAQVGGYIEGKVSGDLAGWSVSLDSSGTTIAVGATSNDDNGSNSGHVRVFAFDDGAWTQIGSDINGEAVEDQEGHSVSLSADGRTLAIGAPSNDDGNDNAGHTRVFELASGNWVQVGADIDGEFKNQLSGTSVSLSDDGQTIAIGSQRGRPTKVYAIENGSWAQVGSDIEPEKGSAGAGYSVSLSGDAQTVAIGSPYYDGITVDTGQMRVFHNVPTVDLSVSSTTGTESDATSITITVTAESAVSGNQTVNLAVTGTDVTADDYTLSETFVTILDGSTTGSVILTVQDDELLEGQETLTVTIASPSAGIELVQSQQSIIIIDDEAVTSEISLSDENDQAVLVNNGDGTFTLQDVNGTFGGDVTFNADPAGVTINGLGGNDVVDLSTATFPLVLDGGSGSDLLIGGPGDDFFNGRSGNDTLVGNRGDDMIFGGGGHDTLNGGSGRDVLRGNSGNDLLFGGAGRDRLYGGANNDRVLGQGGNDEHLSGGSGDDTINGGSGYDQIMERGDVDFVLTDSSLLGMGDDQFSAVEAFILMGGNSANRIDASGVSSSVTLIGGNGKDTLLGGDAADVLRGGAMADVLDGGDGNDLVFGQGGGGDILTGGSGRDTLNGGGGRDQIVDDLVDTIISDALDILLTS